MSDRKLVIEMPTGYKDNAVDLFMDGECGTWRLFVMAGGRIADSGCADFTLIALRAFHAQLTRVLAEIEADPDSFNAEVRKTWELDESDF